MGRYDFDERINREGTSCLKWDFGMARKGRNDLLPLWVADMDFRLPQEVIDELEKRVRHGVFGYTDPDKGYFDSVINWYRTRHGFEIPEDSITVVPGVVYAISLAIRSFTKEGDAILIQQPVYYPFKEMIELNGRKVVNNQLVYEKGQYHIDFEDFERQIVENDVKMFILCSPHNPVGRVWTGYELKKLGDICLAHDVFVFADEIHSDFIYKGYKHVSYMTLGKEYTKKFILGTSASKTFNLAGLQVANIIIPDEEVRKQYKRVNEATGYSQANALGLVATQAVYEKGGKWLDELLEYLEENKAFVREFLKEKLPKVKLIEPEGTYLLWLDFSEVSDSHKKLEKLIVDGAKLWLDPGIIFGRQTALFERINIACPRSMLEQALDQLFEALKESEDI